MQQKQKNIIIGSDEIEEFHGRHSHVAVHFGHYILVFNGRHLMTGQPCSNHKIWMYNLYTQQWRACEVPKSENAPLPAVNACAVRVGEFVYMFGGLRLYESPGLNGYLNDLWQLSRSPDGLFSWCKINITDSAKTPSPRADHSRWEYNGMVLTFGGHGNSPAGFISDYGDFTGSQLTVSNNQLLCFKPSSAEWVNLKCFGSVPTSRTGHSIASLRDKAWLYGGHEFTTHFYDLYHISMCSLTWTHIHDL